MAARLELLAVLGSLALPVIAAPFGFSTRASLAQTEVPKESAANRFNDAFTRWRAGDADAEAEVRAIAEDMRANEDRADVPKIVAHYAELTKAQRAEGMALEARVLDLRTKLGQARDQGIAWDTARIPIEQAIASACTDSLGLADLGARGKALSLRAEYCVSCLEHGVRPEERDRLSDLVEQDAQEAIEQFAAFDILRSALPPQKTLARIAHFRGRLTVARTAYEELAMKARAVHDTKKIVEATEGMLSIANDRGDEVERRLCLESLASLGNANHDWPLARAWAMRLIHEDRVHEALDFLDQFQPPSPADSSPDAIGTRRALAYVRAFGFLRLGEIESARAASVEARNLGRDNFEQRFLEARIELAAGQPEAAIARISDPPLLAALSPRDEGAARTLLGEAQLKLDNAARAVKELERALALAEQTRRASLDEPLVTADEARRFNWIGEWEGAGLETVALLAKAELAAGDPLAAALVCEDWQSRSLRGDNEDADELRARAGVAPLDLSLTKPQLLAWASSAELGLVTWVFGSDSAAVIHVKRSSSGELQAVGEAISLGREELREGVRRLRERAIDGLDTSELSAEIRDTLLPAGIRAHIGQPHSKSDRLLLLLHGPVEALPFELLGLGDKAFDEELSLMTLPGLPALEPGPPLPQETFEHWQLLGSPVDGADLDGTTNVLLPSADTELKQILLSYPDAASAVGASFRRSSLERALLSRDCVHIATHLEVKRGEARSRFPAAGLRLCDGDIASASDIAKLTPKLPLVVLSACETGGGRDADGEGLFGVSRAFLEGGTRNLVVTLWPVADEAAGEFSSSFHAALKAGNKPSQATRIARAELRAAKRSTSDWAAFRFLGRD